MAGIDVYKKEVTPDELLDAAARYRECAAALQAIADSMADAGVESVNLKLATVTGDKFEQVETSIARAVGEAAHQIQRQKMKRGRQ